MLMWHHITQVAGPGPIKWQPRIASEPAYKVCAFVATLAYVPFLPFWLSAMSFISADELQVESSA